MDSSEKKFIEKMIDDKVRKHHPTPSCLSIVGYLLFIFVGQAFMMPYLFASIDIFRGLKELGYSTLFSLNYALGWPVELVEFIIDIIIKST